MISALSDNSTPSSPATHHLAANSIPSPEELRCDVIDNVLSDVSFDYDRSIRASPTAGVGNSMQFEWA